jgi:sucrose-6-phosphate hydrolase SacC (GH32 family)
VKWTKRGLLFEPRHYRLPNGCVDFAQSPQALVFDGFVRIYFSTRSRDAGGQYLSHIAFVDVDKCLQQVLRTATNPVMPLGATGCFDEHGIFPINVVRHDGKIYAFTCGWSRRVSVPVETAIGLAVSHDDGLTFERVGPGPVMAASPAEPFLVGDPFVLIRDGRWHMWYIYGTSWLETLSDPGPVRVYKIAHATSADGMAWQRDGVPIIADALGAHECQALPTVFEHDGLWHMYFCYRQATDFRANRDRGYRLGYAWSSDLRHWTRDDASGGLDVSPSGWDAEMLCYPHAFWCNGQAYLLYNGNAFGRDGFGVAVMAR